MPATRSSRMTTAMEQNRLRQRSGSQTSLLDPPDRRQTYGGLRRSTSNANLRTPRHASRSPGNRTPSTVTGLVSNSEQNRRMAAENTAKVIELIQSCRSFFKSLNLSNGGLKAMTLNQFIDIISFLMMKIGGKNTISKIRNNHEEVIINFLKAVNYPYAVNKSCLKTPNAHHSFPEVIAILAFLCDLVRDIKKYAVPTEMPLMPCDRLLTSEFTQLFFNELLTNYCIYLQEDKNNPPPKLEGERITKSLDDYLFFKEGQTKLLNGYIAAKKQRDDLTMENLAARAEKLKESSEELQRNLVASDCEKFFNNIEAQLEELEKEYIKTQEILLERRNHLKMVTMVYDDKAQKLAIKQAELKKLVHQVQHQTYTTLDIKQLIAKETSIKNSIAMIHNEKNAIQVETADSQVKMARLHKLKLDGIKKFNLYTFHITKTLMQSQTFQQLNVIDYTIDPIASAETIQNTCLRLNRLSEKCANVKQEHIEQIEQNKATLAEYKAQYTRVKEKYTDQMVKFQKANKKVDLLNQKCANDETEGLLSMANLRREIAEKIAIKQRIDDEIVELHKKTEELKIKNIQMFEDGERQANDIIRAKQMLCRELDKLNNYIDDYTDAI